MSGLLGRKKGMTQVFNEQGLVVPVTIIEAGPCYVSQIKTKEIDGYDAVQLAFDEAREKVITKPRAGHFKKAGIKSARYLREFDFSDIDSVEVGKEVKVDIFAEGSMVRVVGVSKGKGFQGTVKRHGFGGGPKTHGQSDRLRAPGSIGQSSYPSRVIKGIKMSGRMGNERQTLKGVQVIKIDAENNLIFLKGPVPGAKNSLVEITN
jgi:large subunit ribosomal protein L3